MTCLAKLRQEPPHFQNLLNWCNSFAAAQMSGSPWNIKEKHAQLLCHYKSLYPNVPIGACFAGDRQNRPQKPLQRQWDGVQVFKPFIPFAAMTDRHISDCVKKTETLFEFCPSKVLCAYFLQNQSSLRHESSQKQITTTEAPLSGIAALPVRGRVAHLGEALLFSFTWDVPAQLCVGALANYERWNADKLSEIPLKVSTNKIIST